LLTPTGLLGILKLQQPTKPLKISVIAPDLSGGGTTRVYLVAQVLQRLAENVEVVGFSSGDSLYPPPPKGLSVKSIAFSDVTRPLDRLKHLLPYIDGDLIYAIKPKLTSLGVALLRKLQTKRPVLVDIDDWELSWHGGDEHRYRPTPKQFFRDILKKQGALRHEVDHPFYLEGMEKMVRYADGITVNTGFLKNRFGGVYLPNGRDTDLFDPSRVNPQISRQRYGLSNYRVLMFPGTARPHKGLEDVLMALDRLNQPDLRLVIAGGRKPDDYEDRLIEQWGRWMIKLPRHPIEQMPEVVAAAHVVVVPQRNTPTANAQFPLKLTDAMAMAKPILSTRVGDIPEILGETGYLVDANAPDQIADKLQWIFQNLDQANHLAVKARERCVKHYSIDAMAAILSEMILGLQ
jgi:glycosyltransferase involved in cell wall biosynthesis